MPRALQRKVVTTLIVLTLTVGLAGGGWFAYLNSKIDAIPRVDAGVEPAATWRPRRPGR